MEITEALNEHVIVSGTITISRPGGCYNHNYDYYIPIIDQYYVTTITGSGEADKTEDDQFKLDKRAALDVLKHHRMSSGTFFILWWINWLAFIKLWCYIKIWLTIVALSRWLK